MTKINRLLLSLLLLAGTACAQKTKRVLPGNDLAHPGNHIFPGAERMAVYLPMLKGKRVAIFANNTSLVGDQNLVDTLHKLGIDIKVIFGPEHGFRGNADAGAQVGNATDPATGIPVVSLYGKKRKPSAEDLKDIDLMIFDIQDVGTRFYTYISSLQEYLEAAIENKKTLLLLDRPNPNGFYVDGPVLDPAFKSFVGLQPIPIVYGMTEGEYAQMLLRENLTAVRDPYQLVQIDQATPAKETALSNTPHFKLVIIPCSHYTHTSKYVLPVKPSPNLPDMQSVYLYPSTCFFEGTACSEGRGTDRPFQVFGHPSLPHNLYAFTPQPMPGATRPKHDRERCYGWDLGGSTATVLQEIDNRVQVKWLLEAYRLFPQKDSFFLPNHHFDLLAGNDILREQVENGVPESVIRKSWEPALSRFRKMRKKYLLYEDF